jgi:nitrogen fixation NifU-like protein
MKDTLYREVILDLYRNPKNKGEIKNADFEAESVNPLCGDKVKIQLKISSKNKIIEKALFSGSGCVISQASASLLCTYIIGKKPSDIKKINSDDIINLIGIKPSPSRLGCAILGLKSLKEVVKNAV